VDSGYRVPEYGNTAVGQYGPDTETQEPSREKHTHPVYNVRYS